MDDGIAIALAAVGLGAVYFLTRPRSGPPGVAPAGSPTQVPSAGTAVPPPSGPSALRQLELSTPQGGLAAATGGLAQRAPTWLKVAVPVIGLNSAVQSVIDHPSRTLSTIGHDAKSAASTVGNVAKNAYNAVASIF